MRFARSAAAMLLAVVLAACAGDSPVSVVPAVVSQASDAAFAGVPGGQKCASVTVAPSSATLSIGGQVALAAMVYNKKGTVIPGAPVQWSSASVAVAAVSSTGLVTGVAPGTTTITARCASNTTVVGSASVVVQ